MKQKANYLKKRFGQLKVVDCIVESTGNNKGGVWRCLCSCGQFINVKGYNLHWRNSCGCLSRKVGISKRNPEQKAINEAYQLYKRGAINPMSKVEWSVISKAPCTWCSHIGINQPCMRDSNIVPCCDECRRMIRDIPIDKFMDKIKQIYKKLPKK